MDKLIITTEYDLSNLIAIAVEKAVQKSNQQQEEKITYPELLSISQAAQYLNLAKQTLYGFTSKGEIPFLKKGKKLYFKKSELTKWINTGKKI